MSDITINININIDDPNSDPVGGGGDFVAVSSLVLYIIGFIGMFIMLFNIPTHLIFMGIIAMAIYVLPLLFFLVALIFKPFIKPTDNVFDAEDNPFAALLYDMLYGGGSFFKKFFKKVLVPLSFLFFNIFLGLFWILYSIQSVSHQTLIAFIIPCMYAMYYYPCVLFVNASKRENKKILWAGIISIAVSFITFLALHDTLLEIDDVLGVALLQTMITVFSTFIILIVRILYHNRKKFSIGLLVAYILVILGIGSSSLIILPKINAENYEQAKVYIEDGEYSEARAILNKMLRYKDSEELYNSIKYKDLKVGEKLTIGTQLDKPDGLSRKDLTWTVIKVEGNKALVMSDAILTSIDSNPLDYWNQKGNQSVRNMLINMQGLFEKDELARIADYTYELEANGKTFTVTDKLFILSQEELEEYLKDEEIFKKKDTSYNDHQILGYSKGDFDYSWYYCYYVRNTDEDGKWIIADCENQEFITKNNKYVGIRPVFYITMDE